MLNIPFPHSKLQGGKHIEVLNKYESIKRGHSFKQKELKETQSFYPKQHSLLMLEILHDKMNLTDATPGGLSCGGTR